MAVRPMITLTTDFGTADFYVAAMKAKLLAQCPDARLIDITHEIPRHDVVAGSIMVERAVASFSAGTVHLAVIDPGVGTDRALMIAEIGGSVVVCPDNGLVTWAWRRQGGGRAYVLNWRPASSSNTFHGRDVMAPVAGQLAAGARAGSFGRELGQPFLLDLHPAKDASSGMIIHIDHFGNATTNIPAELAMKERGDWRVGNHNVGRLRRTYGDVNRGEPLALIGSSELLEIAVRDGSAAGVLTLRVGDAVRAESA